VARRRAHGVGVSVCLPAKDVAGTVGPIVEAIRREWMGPRPLADQIVVIDSGSSDDSAGEAAEAGAEVMRAADILPDIPPRPGKGEALWKSLAVVTGDLVVWLDADVHPFDPAFVPELLGPLLHCPGVDYVKGFYRRDLGDRRGDGGRVTEICARPLIALAHPEPAGFIQPLAGEAAGRVGLLRQVPFFTGYAVEIGLLVELHRRVGLAGLAQVDLGRRGHRHQTTAVLGPMGLEIMRAVLEGTASPAGGATFGEPVTFARPVRRGGAHRMEEVTSALVRRPPLDRVIPPRPAAPKAPLPRSRPPGGPT